MLNLLLPRSLRFGRKRRFSKRHSDSRLFIVSLIFATGFAALVGLPAGLPTAAISAPPAAFARSFEARVVRVSDGDSLRVLFNNQEVPLRLEGIDAPERGQPWSRNSRQALASLVAGRTVQVTVASRDRYGRSIATVRVGGEAGPRNVNLEMVASGSAWVYRAYTRDPVKLVAEADARRAGRGLWSLPENQRVPPWDYRRQQRQGIISGR
jgi:endonuclease YncB( thermonuclease family)